MVVTDKKEDNRLVLAQIWIGIEFDYSCVHGVLAAHKSVVMKLS
jgi:hypothetical protein